MVKDGAPNMRGVGGVLRMGFQVLRCKATNTLSLRTRFGQLCGEAVLRR